MIEFTGVFDKRSCNLQGRKRGMFENCKVGGKERMLMDEYFSKAGF